MKLGYHASVLALLLGLGVAHAQVPGSDPNSELPMPRTLSNNPDSPFAEPYEARPKILTFDANYLFWYFRSERFPNDLALIAVNFVDSIAVPLEIDQSKRGVSGGRLTLGWWDEDRDVMLEPWGAHLRSFGYEISGMFFGRQGISFRNEAAPIVFRPFFDVNNNSPAAVFVAAPGLASGRLDGSASGSLWGIEANVWQNLCDTSPSTCLRFGVMAGLRNVNLETDFGMRRSTVYDNVISPIFPAFAQFAGNRLDDFDAFATRNHFFGAQVGASLKTYILAAELSATMKLGLGWNHEVLEIDGAQVRTRANGTKTTLPGGLFALSTNIGSHSQTRFVVMPEVNLNVSIPLGSRIALNAGYSLFYWSRVANAVDQLDRALDVTKIPSFPTTATPTGLSNPGVLFRERNLFLNGFNLGFTITW